MVTRFEFSGDLISPVSGDRVFPENFFVLVQVDKENQVALSKGAVLSAHQTRPAITRSGSHTLGSGRKSSLVRSAAT